MARSGPKRIQENNNNNANDSNSFFSQTMPDKNLIFISGQSFILMVERIKSVGRCLIKASWVKMVGGGL